MYSELSKEAKDTVAASNPYLVSNQKKGLLRQVSMGQQYVLLVKRMYLQAIRIPIAFFALICMGIF